MKVVDQILLREEEQPAIIVYINNRKYIRESEFTEIRLLLEELTVKIKSLHNTQQIFREKKQVITLEK